MATEHSAEAGAAPPRWRAGARSPTERATPCPAPERCGSRRWGRRGHNPRRPPHAAQTCPPVRRGPPGHASPQGSLCRRRRTWRWATRGRLPPSVRACLPHHAPPPVARAIPAAGRVWTRAPPPIPPD
eukprot:scaffold6618_cov139-Isochrysis_galbana.AAC.4